MSYGMRLKSTRIPGDLLSVDGLRRMADLHALLSAQLPGSTAHSR
jgi:hypothetical protein